MSYWNNFLPSAVKLKWLLFRDIKLLIFFFLECVKREKKNGEKKLLRLDWIMLIYSNIKGWLPKIFYASKTLGRMYWEINTQSRCLCESNEIRVSNLLISIRARSYTRDTFCRRINACDNLNSNDFFLRACKTESSSAE